MSSEDHDANDVKSGLSDVIILLFPLLSWIIFLVVSHITTPDVNPVKRTAKNSPVAAGKTSDSEKAVLLKK